MNKKNRDIMLSDLLKIFIGFEIGFLVGAFYVFHNIDTFKDIIK